MEKVKLVRHTHIAEKIVFIDGISGTGKSILGPVLGSFENMEKQRLEQIYEYLCFLNYFNKIELDAAISLMRLYADLALFNSMISREVNLRLFDDSGILNNPHGLVYFSRLFKKDGDKVLEEIDNKKPLLQIMTHQIFPAVSLAFAAYGKRLKVIEMVRHPVYMIDHWMSYVERYGKDKREFTLWLKSEEVAVPWFAFGWEKKFKESTTIDKTIYSIEWLIDKTKEAYDSLDEEEKEQVMYIPFEKFVKYPDGYIQALQKFLNTKTTRKTKKVLKKQKCPRETLSSGRGHKQYGWEKSKKGVKDKADFNHRWEKIEKKASNETIRILKKISEEYENQFDIKFE